MNGSLPEGFVLDQPATAQSVAAPAPIAGLPDGFVLDQPGPSAATQAPTKQPFGIGDIWPMRLAKSLYEAAKLPGEVFQGTAQVPQSANMPGGESTQNIGRTLDLASLISPITPRAVSSLAKPVAAGPPSPEALQTAIDTGFKQARSTGAEINPAALGRVSQEAQSGLTGAGIDATSAPKTFAVLGQLERAPSESSVTIANLHSLRKNLGNISNDAARQGANTEAMAARTAQQSLDTYLSDLPKGDVVAGDPQAAARILRDAIGNAAAKFRSERVQDIADVAKGNVAASNSFGQLGRQIRVGANTFLKSNDTRGFSPAEIAQAEAVRRSGRVPGIVGSIMGGGGPLQAVLAGTFGHALGAPGPVVPAVGAAIKQMESMAAQRQLRRLDEMVRARSPLGQQMMGSPTTTPLSPATIAALRGISLLPPVLAPQLSQPNFPPSY